MTKTPKFATCWTNEFADNLRRERRLEETLALLKELVELEYLSEYAIQDGKLKQAKELIAKMEGQSK